MKKKLKRISDIIFYIFLGFCSVLIIISLHAHLNNRPPSLFGFSFAVVPTNSMEPTIKANGSIIFHSISYEELVFKINESNTNNLPIIVFRSNNKNVVHRVVEVTDTGIITKGDNNQTVDTDLVTSDNLIGIVISIHNNFTITGIFANYLNLIFLVISLSLTYVMIKQIIIVVYNFNNKNQTNKIDKELELTKLELERLKLENEIKELKKKSFDD